MLETPFRRSISQTSCPRLHSRRHPQEVNEQVVILFPESETDGRNQCIRKVGTPGLGFRDQRINLLLVKFKIWNLDNFRIDQPNHSKRRYNHLSTVCVNKLCYWKYTPLSCFRSRWVEQGWSNQEGRNPYSSDGSRNGDRGLCRSRLWLLTRHPVWFCHRVRETSSSIFRLHLMFIHLLRETQTVGLWDTSDRFWQE